MKEAKDHLEDVSCKREAAERALKEACAALATKDAETKQLRSRLYEVVRQPRCPSAAHPSSPVGNRVLLSAPLHSLQIPSKPFAFVGPAISHFLYQPYLCPLANLFLCHLSCGHEGSEEESEGVGASTARDTQTGGASKLVQWLAISTAAKVLHIFPLPLLKCIGYTVQLSGMHTPLCMLMPLGSWLWQTASVNGRQRVYSASPSPTPRGRHEGEDKHAVVDGVSQLLRCMIPQAGDWIPAKWSPSSATLVLDDTVRSLGVAEVGLAPLRLPACFLSQSAQAQPRPHSHTATSCSEPPTR